MHADRMRARVPGGRHEARRRWVQHLQLQRQSVALHSESVRLQERRYHAARMQQLRLHERELGMHRRRLPRQSMRRPCRRHLRGGRILRVRDRCSVWSRRCRVHVPEAPANLHGGRRPGVRLRRQDVSEPVRCRSGRHGHHRGRPVPAPSVTGRRSQRLRAEPPGGGVSASVERYASVTCWTAA
jgi:hypothetical protein